MPSATERVSVIRAAFPVDGLFANKNWGVTPEAFPLSTNHIEILEKLGPVLLKFTQACNLLYRQSVKGKQPSWIADLLDRGKSPELIAIERSDEIGQQIPLVIRPDLILTENGFGLSELDSVPGGIGLTAWLNETYAGLGELVLGGARGMHDGFASIFPTGDIVVAQEAADYFSEFVYLAGKDRVFAAESYHPNGRPIYRFFECFDWSHLPTLHNWKPGQSMTPPLKPYLEEKLWLALFWLRPLQSFWRRELGEKWQKFLQQIIPYSWIVDPTPLPSHAVIPELGIQDFRELGQFSQKERSLILKISGFSPDAWGARGVYMGSDLSTPEWTEKIIEALEAFPHHPYILQRFIKGGLFTHPYVDQDGAERQLEGRARVCPYYFIQNDRSTLGGVLVTHCPADKKLLHGMKDAILCPAKAG